MKRLAKRKALVLISVGMSTIAASQVFSHYVALPDLAKGAFLGLGIGLLFTATMFVNLKPME
ncbi:hypothetical protein [Pontibacter actiniarum]|uniref:hypothetical protein n=1 Tax=Pontibacter actiniarum TaxID=323450 RepID=UPI0012FCD751|nr:hypothetical protein [Pontibacter actiniarum]